MAMAGRSGSMSAASCCLLAVFLVAIRASAFPYTYPSAFPFTTTSTDTPATPIDDESSSTPPVPLMTPPPSTQPPANSPPPATPTGQRGQVAGTPVQGQVGGGSKVWCIAKPSADEEMLIANIAYACEEGGIDCAPIQPGGPCFVPKNTISHASFVMNMYYQKNQRNWWTCHFNKTGLVVFADPSFGQCIYSPQ